MIAIDGACRRNGKPDCLSVGSVFVKSSEGFAIETCPEQNSTNQRGELTALIKALEIGDAVAKQTGDTDIYLITDSEYVFNTVSKEWYVNWGIKGWKTSTGDPVKNRDLWERAAELLNSYKIVGYELIPFHVKGHLFSFGKVTSADMLRRDPTGELLYQSVRHTIIDTWETKEESTDAALQLYERNNGHQPPIESFVEMIICNTVADLAAGEAADKINAAWLKQS